MNIHSDSTHESGIATAAIVVIAAVVIGGGVLLVTSGSSTSDVDTATDTDAMMEEEASTTNAATFSSEAGAELMVEFMADGEAKLTLPSGEVKAVSRVESASGAKYESAEGDFTFWNNGDEATVMQEGETTFEGTVMEEDAMMEDEEEAMTEEDAEASSSVEVEADVDVSGDAEGDMMMEGEAEGEAEGDAMTQ